MSGELPRVGWRRWEWSERTRQDLEVRIEIHLEEFQFLLQLGLLSLVVCSVWIEAWVGYTRDWIDRWRAQVFCGSCELPEGRRKQKRKDGTRTWLFEIDTLQRGAFRQSAGTHHLFVWEWRPRRRWRWLIRTNGTLGGRGRGRKATENRSIVEELLVWDGAWKTSVIPPHA